MLSGLVRLGPFVSALTRTYVHGGAGGFTPTTGSLNTFVPIVMGPVRPILADLAGGTPGSGAVRHYAHDHLRSTRGIYDAGKNLTGTWEPTPYGEAHTDTLAADVTHRYTGHALDTATGAYHTAYRTYAPTQARWLQPDPLGMVDGPNVYGYLMASPVAGSDPLGLQTCASQCAPLLAKAQATCTASRNALAACSAAVIAAARICGACVTRPTPLCAGACTLATTTAAIACLIADQQVSKCAAELDAYRDCLNDCRSKRSGGCGA